MACMHVSVSFTGKLKMRKHNKIETDKESHE